MKKLTIQEEEAMLSIWRLKGGFIKEILDNMADDTPMGWYPFVEGPDAETDLGIALNNPESELHKEAKEWLKLVTR